jgi:3-hydroxybutyryl-CoA dehydrogenase
MQLVVRANEEQRKAFLQKNIPSTVQIRWFDENELIEETEGDVFFDLQYDKQHTGPNLFVKGRLVFANAVVTTLADMKYFNHVRINAWPGFFENEILELASPDEGMRAVAEEVLNELGWKYKWAPDEPGMIAPRIIAMIINEAYFGLEEKISTKEEIDIAMKLGTNYPFGPFEWAEKIGIRYIYQLLKKLEETDPRYKPASLLEAEALT